MTKKAVWTLPDTIHPENSVGWCVPVPDDPYYRAAFWGALLNLASAYNWQDDIDHKAKEVALVWREIIDNLQHCIEDCGCDDMEFRQVDCTKLQMKCNGDWVTIFDISNCIPTGVQQPPAGGTITTGDCQEYDVVLAGNNQWLLPNPVDDGYTVEITLAVGGWQDGSGLTGWYCPDGTPYVLGACVGSAGHVGGDPSATAYHGSLVAQIDGAFLPAYNRTITVSGGGGPRAMAFQMNDSDIPDNAGSISFHVKVCANEIPTWCATWLGGDGLGAWSTPVTLEGHSAGSYNSGTDAIDGTSIGGGNVWSNAELVEALDITRVTVEYDYNSAVGQSCDLLLNGSAYASQLTPVGTGSNSLDVAVVQSVSSIAFVLSSGGVGGAYINATKITITGTGTPPATGVSC